MNIEKIKTDLLIIGGGTAGCYAAITAAARNSGKSQDLKILIVEKANIKRSGCLAAGVNALNAYITEGRTPKDYVEYAKKDADGIVREDLLYSISERFNEITAHLEKLGLVILKDKDGKYDKKSHSIRRDTMAHFISLLFYKLFRDKVIVIHYL